MRLRLLPAVAVAVLAVAACGSDEAPEDADGTAAPATSAEDTVGAGEDAADEVAEDGADPDGGEDPADGEEASGDGGSAGGDGGAGGDGIATARVIEAIEAAGSARVVLTSALEEADLTSEGVIDFTQEYRVDLTTTIAAPEGDLTTRVVGLSPDEVYVQLPEVPGWIAVGDPAEAGLGVDVTSYADPDESWELWGSEGDLPRVGEEEVDGVATTRYQVPEAALADGVGAVDVWIDGDDLPVQTEVTVTDPEPSTILIRYSDWGTAVEVTAPPADEIIDF